MQKPTYFDILNIMLVRFDLFMEKTALPEEVPIIVNKEYIVLPNAMQSLFFIDKQAIDAIEKAFVSHRVVVLIPPLESYKQEYFEVKDLNSIGCACKINQLVHLPEGGIKVLIEGHFRVRLKKIISHHPFPIGIFEEVEEVYERNIVNETLVQSVISLLKISQSLGKTYPVEIFPTVEKIYDAGKLADFIALSLGLNFQQLLEVLNTIEPADRLKKVFLILSTEVEFLQLRGKLQAEVAKEMGKTQRDYLLRQQMKIIQKELYKEKDFSFILGKTQKMREVWEQIEKVANTNTTVLLRGESGTGKEMVATLIHQKSSRNDRPMITVNCTTLTEHLLESELFGHIKGSFTGALENKKGLFEVAHNGTIFLDEIGDMPINLQTKLLRVLQNGEIRPLGSNEVKKIDVRVIAATNRNLEQLIEEGKFREDLYYRLNVFSIHLPPLRERKDDIPYFLHHLIETNSKKLGKKIASYEKEIIKYLKAYHWPGNIRELANVVERAIILAQGEELKLKDFPIHIQSVTPEIEITNLKKNLWEQRDEQLAIFEKNLLRIGNM